MRLARLPRRVIVATSAAAAGVVLAGGIALASSRAPGHHIDYGHGKLPCGIADDGLPYPPGSGTMAREATCVVRWRVSQPAAYGTRMVLTAPSGHFTVWRLRLDYSR